jgi:hypothetical protein
LQVFRRWELQGPSLKQAPPGQCISSPAAYLLETGGTTAGAHEQPVAVGCASGEICAGASWLEAPRRRVVELKELNCGALNLESREFLGSRRQKDS